MPPPLPPKDLGFGLGPRTANVSLGIFLDFVCPYSRKMYNTVRKEVYPKYQDRSLRVVFYPTPQPWHPQSAQTHEAAIAVGKLAGEEAFWSFADVLFEKSEDFYDVPTYDKTRGQVYAELADLAGRANVAPGVTKEAVLELLALQKIEGAKNPGTGVVQELKWAVRHHRTLGVHVTPTTILNGIIFDSSSGWTLAQWDEVLGPLLE